MTALSQDASVSSTEGADDILDESKAIVPLSLSLTPYQLNIINSFPWMAEFIKLCHKDMINANARSLEKLMNFYHKNVSQSVKECYSRPIRAKKLKGSMSEVLMFFHMSYNELKPPLEHSSYLAKMSDLMALYLDMEIKASRNGSESLCKIASKLTSCLIVYFGRSHDYILDTILKTKMITRNSWELCDLIFRRVLRESPGSSVYVITYIRYLLAFKLWKGIMGSAEERKKIQAVAERNLKLPPGFREKLSCGSVLRDILPRIPKNKTDITRFLLEAKYIVRDKIKMFLKAVADPKLQCALDRQNFASVNNSSVLDEKEDNEHNLLINDWSNMGIESDIGDSLLLNKIIYGSDNKKLHKLKNGIRCVGKNELKKKKKKIGISLKNVGEDDKEGSFQIPLKDVGKDDKVGSFKIPLKDIGEDDKESVDIDFGIPLKDIGEDGKESGHEMVGDSTLSDIKPEVEEIIKKDQVNQANSICEGDTMDVAAEVELPSSPSELNDFPTIKLEPQPSQSKENVVYPWGMPNLPSYYNHNGFDYTFDSKSEEFVVDKTPAIFDLLSKHEIGTNKEQTRGETYSGIADHCSAQGLGVIPLEQVIIDPKSIDALRAQGILFEKCFPPAAVSTPIEERSNEIQSETLNEELPVQEHNEEVPLGEHNEELSFGELEIDIESINQGKCNEEGPLEECSEERTSEVNNVERSSEHDGETPTENNESLPERGGLVHDFTLKNDNKIYKFQVKLMSYWTKLNRRTWISLLFPLFSEQELRTLRCPCFRCSENYDIIMKNWKSALTTISRLPDKTDENGVFADDFDNNILKGMKESLESEGLKLLVWKPELDELHKKIEELIKEENEHSNLPLKKRKAFSFNTYVKDEKSEMSYPNTPMISIAEVELAKEKYRFNALSLNHPSTCNGAPINYMPDYISHPGYSNPADIKYESVMVQSNITNISSEQSLVPGAFTTTFIPEHQEPNRPKFKTPAQLKEFQHLSAAQDLINFAHTSRTYYNENQEPRRENEREKRKTRQKTKSTRKRKRTT